MAAAFLLRRRLSLGPPASFPQRPYLYIISNTSHGLHQAQSPLADEKWRRLPPFTASSVTPSQLGKKLSGACQDEIVEPVTALKWVLDCCPNLPRSLVQKLFRLRQVRRQPGASPSDPCLNLQAPHTRPRRVTAKHTMISGDQLFLPSSVQELPSVDKQIFCTEDETKFTQSLELHRDSAIIAINKPAGLAVQGGVGIKRSLDVLAATALRYEYAEPPRLVHRLDKDSSGVLVLGRTLTSATFLHSIFREKTVRASNIVCRDCTKGIFQKKYLALVIGIPKQTRGLISAALTKVVLDDGKSDRITIVDSSQSKSSQVAITTYKVIKSSDLGFAWLELYPLTGRKHQLRVHCAEVLGTPIVGDYKYGLIAHRKWRPVTFSENLDKDVQKPSSKAIPFRLDLAGSSINEECPSLHLHCRQMTIPDVVEALKHIQSLPNCYLSELPKLNLVAPLPSHMQKSWDILNYEHEPGP